MRIEIDPKLGKQLDAIKEEEYSIYGRGHSETVRFLANYYRKHKPIQQLVEDLITKQQRVLLEIDATVEAAMERAILKALKQVIVNLFQFKDEKGTLERSAAAAQGDVEGR